MSIYIVSLLVGRWRAALATPTSTYETYTWSSFPFNMIVLEEEKKKKKKKKKKKQKRSSC